MTSDRRILFVTHADVVIDPAVPVPLWGLSERGRARHAAFNAAYPIARIGAVYSSAETKARDGAAILAAAIGIAPVIVEALRENDRSATGYLPPVEFQATADRFFAEPNTSVRGWERAVDAQARIVAAVAGIAAGDTSAGEIAVVAHGGVGALLIVRLLGQPISRRFDQPAAGGGNFFAFD